MKKFCALLLSIFSVATHPAKADPDPTPPPLKVAIVGLAHGHVGGFLSGGALVPAGGLLTRPDAHLVGIVEPDRALFDQYAGRLHLAPDLYFPTIEALAAKAHPDAVLVCTATSEHPQIVEQCAALGIHVMVEKPLAVSYQDALAIQTAAERGKIHVLVDYETSWYRSLEATRLALREAGLGRVYKVVFRDGHQGPKEIGVSPEFFKILTDPKLNGAGALYDFGCYGPDIFTALFGGMKPESVTAVTRQLDPGVYPQVDDEADLILNYPGTVALVEASWHWPYSVKQMDLYGEHGFVHQVDSETSTLRVGIDQEVTAPNHPILAPQDDPLHYLAAVLRGEVAEENSFSSLKTNVTVCEILDAARRSARTGKTVTLPLEP